MTFHPIRPNLPPKVGAWAHLRGRVRSRGLIAVGVGGVAVVAAGLVVTGQESSATGGYRTAVVSTETVDQVLDRVGTIEPVAQASVAFPVSGTVASVDVAVGDQVSTGQALARLGTAELEAVVAEKEAALDAAELTLERALDGEDVSGGTGGTDAAPSDESAGVAPASLTSGSLAVVAADPSISTSVVNLASRATPAVGDPELGAAQEAVLDAQQQVDLDLARADQALADAQQICAAVGEAVDVDTAGAATGSTTTTTTPTDEGDGGVAACQAALTAVLDAQEAVDQAQDELADAIRAYDGLLAEWADEVGRAGTGSGQGGGTGSDTPSGGSTGTGTDASRGSGGSAGTSAASSAPTSEELVSYQKAVDAAAADLAVAEQAVAQATIVSPITGSVQAVDLAVGDEVTAGASAARIVVVGDGGYEVTTTVTVEQLADLDLGQAVSVAPDGADAAIDGEVVRIGVTGTASGSTTTYPVTIGLTEPGGDLRNGATASLAIVTDETAEAVAVPTSALSTDSDATTVRVLEGGEPITVDVEVGAVGDVWTEVTSGLEVGQTVVLADLDEPLPGSATDTSSGNTTRFPGAFRE